MVTTLAKQFAFRCLPDGLLHHVRKLHYARKLSQARPEPEMAIIARLVSANSVVIDIGANFGLYTRFLAEAVGPTGQVHSIEPIPSTYDVLRSNVHRLQLRQVTTYHLAISDHADDVIMELPEYDSGGTNYYEARIVAGGSGGPNCVRVPARKLDDLYARLPKIELIKCDVEGHELAVLRGASTILKQHQPAWMIEVSGNPDNRTTSAHEVVRLMASHGYQAYLMDGDQLRARAQADRAVNYFFLRPEHVVRLTVTSPPAAPPTPAGGPKPPAR